jgi:hypothetical protein
MLSQKPPIQRIADLFLQNSTFCMEVVSKAKEKVSNNDATVLEGNQILMSGVTNHFQMLTSSHINLDTIAVNTPIHTKVIIAEFNLCFQLSKFGSVEH